MKEDLDPRPLVGIRYRWGGRDPARGLDCWGVVRALMPWVPDYTAASSRAVADAIASNVDAWRRVDHPEPGDVLVLGTSARAEHVGVLTRYGVLHATRSLGVVLQPLAAVLALYPVWEARRWG